LLVSISGSITISAYSLDISMNLNILYLTPSVLRAFSSALASLSLVLRAW
jgi:hypothetical protein